MYILTFFFLLPLSLATILTSLTIRSMKTCCPATAARRNLQSCPPYNKTIVTSNVNSRQQCWAAGVAEWMACSLVKWAAEIESRCCPSQHSTVAYHPLYEGCPEGRPAVYMLIQCTPLLVEKGAPPDVTLRFTTHKQARVQVTEPP